MPTYATPDATHEPVTPLVEIALNGELVTVVNPFPVNTADIVSNVSITADQGAVFSSFGAGVASWAVEATGTFSAGTTLNFEFQLTGGGAWYPAFGVPIGSTADIAVSSVAGGGSITYQGNAAGFQSFRVRAHPFQAGDNIVIKIVGSVATDGGFVSKSLPPGTNSIGNIGVQGQNSAGSVESWKSNLDNITLLSASNVTGTQTSADQININARGLKVWFNITTFGAALTLHIDYKDPVSGQYLLDALTSAAISANTFTQYTIYPGITTTANVSLNDILPRTWRVRVTGPSNSTFTVGASLIL